MVSFGHTLSLAESLPTVFLLLYLTMNYAAELIRRGWTQKRIAREVGCRQGTVSKWVTGISTPGGISMLKLKALCDG